MAADRERPFIIFHLAIGGFGESIFVDGNLIFQRKIADGGIVLKVLTINLVFN